MYIKACALKSSQEFDLKAYQTIKPSQPHENMKEKDFLYATQTGSE